MFKSENKKIKKKILNDKRFKIDRYTFENHLNLSKILFYKVKKIKLGDILRFQDKQIISLENSDVYQYLNNDKDKEKKYENYCKKNCIGDDKKFHNKNIYNNLINQLNHEKYDIKKGAIVVSQFNIIMDGQHRTCILLKNKGPNYKISVVKIYYLHIGFPSYVAYIKYLIKKRKI